MARKGFVQRAISSVTRLFHRDEARRPASRKIGPDDTTKRVARPVHRDSDIPLDRIEHAYTPTQTSLKAGFRTSGADQQRDQEFARGVDDERWNDEDRFTNKSGDPRIGTHGRTYEPGEARAARGRNEEND